MSRDLCVLTDVTALVPGYTAGDDTATDARLTALIAEASRDAMERTQREFTAIVNGTTPLNPRSFDVDATIARRRRLMIGDCAAIASATIKDGQGTTVQTVDLAGVVSDPRIREDWQPIGTLWFRPDAATPAPLIPGYVVEISGTWGFPSIPTTIKEAVARLVVVRFLNDVAAVGTQFADAANRAEFNLAASIRVALDALDRFYVPFVQGTVDWAPSIRAGVAGVDW